MSRIHEYLALGIQYLQKGNLVEAEKLFRHVLAVAPTQTDALHLMGVIHNQNGHPAEGLRLIQKAIYNNPIVAMFHNSAGNSFKALGKLKEAANSFREALQIEPHLGEAHFNLAGVLADQQQWEQAEHHGLVAHQILPQSAPICALLAFLKNHKGDYRQAIHFAETALHFEPSLGAAHQHLGMALLNLGHTEEAFRALKKAALSHPEDFSLWNNLAILSCDQESLDEAESYAQKAMALKPDRPEIWNTLGNIRRARADLEGAYDCYQKAAGKGPNDSTYLSNAIFIQLFMDQDVKTRLKQDTETWNRLYTPLQQGSTPFAYHDKSPNRRLKIGYVSPDFRSHPVGRFVLPLLENHDRFHFEVYAYSSVRLPDPFTHRTKKASDFWRDSHHWDHEELAEKIRADGIDILIDLSMHLAQNRLAVFARKPAPIQVSYLAYPGGSGLPAIDYRWSDDFQDPNENALTSAFEKPESLGLTWVCYDPINETSPVSPLPARKNGHITFGCLNHYSKVTPTILKIWAELLAAIPQSRLRLLCPEGNHRESLLSVFADHQVQSQRIDFLTRSSVDSYFERLASCDICLDTWPYPGIRTTCDSLWMGVPVIHLRGKTPITRAGVGPLQLVGLEDWATSDGAQYVEIAKQFATDLNRLESIRNNLRQKMLDSPLMNAPDFARKVESSLRSMWQRWCHENSPK